MGDRMAVNTNASAWIMVIVMLCGAPRAAAYTLADEVGLRLELLNDSFVSTVRPERTTSVYLTFNLQSVNIVDIKNEQLGVTGWWLMMWEDSRLSWEDSSLAHIPVIQLSSSEIWKPSLVVENSVDDLSAIDEPSIPIRVNRRGTVTWNPPGILLTSCEMDVAHFPFDQQTCSIQVTSFGYTIAELDLFVQEDGVQLKNYHENGEWTLQETWNNRTEYTDDAYTYAKVTFYLRLRRRPTYYGLNTMLPVLLNSLLIPLVFLLPHDAGEKVGYCLTVLLAYVVILTIVSDGLPTSAKSQSYLGVYIALVLTLSGLSVVLAIHSLSIFHRSPDRPVPRWQARLCRHGLTIMRLQCAKDKTRRSVSPARLPDDPKEKIDSRHNSQSPLGFYGKRDNHASSADMMPEVTSECGEPAEGEVSWQLVAQVYDAFFLRVYFFFISACSLAFFLVVASGGA